MIPRRVVVMLEVETDWPLVAFRTPSRVSLYILDAGGLLLDCCTVLRAQAIVKPRAAPQRPKNKRKQKVGR